MSSGGKKQTVGYWYRLLQAFGLCKGPIDALLEFRAGGRVAWRGRVETTTRITVNAGNLWGGEKKEGGLIGQMDIQFGDGDQLANDYLTARLGADQTTYRGKVMAIWRGGRWGAMNPYPKRSEFKVRRILKGWDNDVCWYPEKAEIVLVPELALIEDLAFPATQASQGPFAGVLLEGDFTAEDTLFVDKIAGMTYVAWSNWDSNGDPAAEGKPWTNTFRVTASGVTTDYWPEYYETPEEAELNAIDRSIQLTGSSSYLIWLNDEPVNDNRGGLSIRVNKNGVIAMNPAHIIYDSLTAHDMQREPIGLINVASFRAAADVLYDEGLGLCTEYEDEDIDKFQERILNVIGAGMSQSRENGEYYLDLIRPTPDLSEVVIITSDDVVELTVEPSTLTEMVNQVSVKWFDPERNESRITQPFQNLGAIQAAGRVIPEQSNYPEVPYESLALRLVARDAQARGTPLSKLSLTTNRRGDIWKLRTGQKFRLQVPEDGISDMLCVVGDIDVGTLKDGRIKIKAVQDVYSMPATVYVTPEPGQAPPINAAPTASPNQRMIEAPYVEVSANLTPADLDFFPDDAGMIMTMATQPSAGLNYSIYSAASGLDLIDNGTGEWCPSALIVEEAGYLDREFTLTGATDLARVELGTWALWDDEIVRVDALDPEALAVQLGRGCADTVPAKHAAGSRLWFCGDWSASDELEYVDGDTVVAKLPTRSSFAELPLGQTPELNVEMSQRQFRPYPPAGVLINGDPYPEEVAGSVALTWVHRDRIAQADKLFGASEGSIGPEPGTTYSAEYYTETGTTPLYSETEITAAEASVWEPPNDGIYRLELFSVRDGMESWQRLVHVVLIGEAPTGDPHWDAVATLLRFEGNLNNEKGGSWSLYQAGVLSTAAAKFGTGSLTTTARGGAVGPTEKFDTNADFTIEGWVYCTDSAPLNFVYTSRHLGANNNACTIYFGDGIPLSFQIFNSSGQLQQFISSAGAFPLNAWTHIAITFEKATNTLRIFQSGFKIHESVTTTFWTKNKPAYLATWAHTDQSTRYLRGRLDEWRETVGVCRYTEDFMPPTEPFPNFGP